ncbi:MAG: hypothetical protein RIF41_36765, partial [Polyangiaceae bacterium]
MELNEYKQTIEDLEPKVERLKSLYQQYFMGIEKIPPHVLKKDVERTIWRLRRIRLQNTQAKFKFQQIIQRYNTYSQYWSRILREIEKGTYKRDIVKAAKRFGKDAATAAAGRQAETALRDVEEEQEQDSQEQVWDLSAGIDSYADDAPTPVPARRAAFSEPAADSTGYYDPREWAPHSQPPQAQPADGYAASSFGGSAESYNPPPAGQGYPAPPRAYPAPPTPQAYPSQQAHDTTGQPGYPQAPPPQQGYPPASYSQQQGYPPASYPSPQAYGQPGHAQPGYSPHRYAQPDQAAQAGRGYPPPPDREHYAPRDRSTISQPPPPPTPQQTPVVHSIPEPRATTPGFGPTAAASPTPAQAAKPAPPPIPPRRPLGPPPAPRRPLGPPPGSTARAAAPPKPATPAPSPPKPPAPSPGPPPAPAAKPPPA